MADAWDQVASDPEFQALPSNQKDAVRLHFFQNVVAPGVPQEHLTDARHSFFTDTQPVIAPQSPTEQFEAKLSGPNIAQGMAGVQEAGSFGLSRPSYVGPPAPWRAPGGIAQHLSRIGGNMAALLAPGAIAERTAAAGLGVAGSVAETVAPEAVSALKMAGSKAVSGLSPIAQSVLARIAPGAAARGLGWGALGAAQVEGETGGKASPQQLMQSSLGAAASGVLVPPAISALGEAVSAPAARLSQAITSRFPGIFSAAEHVKAGVPEPVPAEPPEANASPSPESPPSPAAGQSPEAPPNAQPGPLSSRAPRGPEPATPQTVAGLGAMPNATNDLRPMSKIPPQEGSFGDLGAKAPFENSVAATYAGVPRESQDIFQRAALEQAGSMESATRGVQSFRDTQENASKLGMSVDDFLGAKPGAAWNDSQKQLLRQFAAAKNTEMFDLADKVAGGDDSVATRLKLNLATEQANGLKLAARGAAAEAGRSLNAQKMITAALQTGDERIMSRAMDMVEGRPLNQDEIVSLAKARATGDPKQLFDALNALRKPSAGDITHAMVRNSLLSSPKSMETVGLSSAVQNVLRLANIPVRAGIDKAMSAMTGAERTTFAGQFLPAVKGAWEALPEAASNAYTKLTTGVSPSDLSGLQMGRAPVLHGLLDAPERIIGALHQFAFTVARESEMASQAAKLAIKDGSADFEGAMQKYLDAPTPEMVKAADAAGADATFTKKLGKPGQTISNLFNMRLSDMAPSLTPRIAADIQPLKFINPFMRVGTNILKEATKYSGAGLISGATKGGEAGMADMAKGAIGVPIAAYAASMLSQGKMWGSGPPTTNAAERDRFLREHGGVTNAAVIGGKIVPFDRVGEPLNVMLKVMANLHDAAVYNGQHPSDKDAERIAYSFGKSIVDNSYTANIANALNAMQDPAKGKAFLQQMGQQFIPYSGALRFAAQNLDTTVRDTRGKSIGEAAANTVKSITPGLTQTLPARRDELGNEITRKQNLTPWKILPSENDPYTQFLKDVDVTPPNVPARLGSRPLSPALQSQFLQERGEKFKQVIDSYQGQEGSPYTAVAVKQQMKQAQSELAGKYRAMAELDAHGLPATPENAQRAGFAVGMPWFKNMSESEKADYLKSLTQ